MAWKKTTTLIGTHLTRHGLQKAISAGMICKEAERLYPGMFHAVSVRNGVLTVTIAPEQKVSIKMIEGKLVGELQTYATKHHLPSVTRIRTTSAQE